jgi:hypothetical protein
MSGSTAHDPLRGQLLRDIENALVLQGSRKFPEVVHFTLLTPRIFKLHPRSRGYGLVFQAYQRDGGSIAEDLLSQRHDVRQDADWQYPASIHSRISALRLHWVDYETLLAGMPESSFKEELLSVARRNGSLLTQA